MADDPVSVIAPAELAAATVVWRHRGKLYVTVVAKESLALDAGGGKRVEPAPIARAEQDAGAGRITPDDLAPYVARADVWVVGHARGAAGAGLAVALTARRGGAALLDKSARVVADATGAAWLGPLGPVSKRWPARARFIASIVREPIEGNVIAVPDAIDWAYFQTAPPDQQIQWLMPGDQVSLEAGEQRYSLRVPVASPAARLLEPLPGQAVIDPAAPGGLRPTSGQLLLMRADCLAIDVDAGRAHLLYRANSVLVGDPSRAVVELGLEDDIEPALAGTLEVRVDRSALGVPQQAERYAASGTERMASKPSIEADRSSSDKDSGRR